MIPSGMEPATLRLVAQCPTAPHRISYELLCTEQIVSYSEKQSNIEYLTVLGSTTHVMEITETLNI